MRKAGTTAGRPCSLQAQQWGSREVGERIDEVLAITAGEWNLALITRRFFGGRVMGHAMNVAAPVKYVQLSVFKVLTGYTVKAVRRKIEEGVWLEDPKQYLDSVSRRFRVDLQV